MKDKLLKVLRFLEKYDTPLTYGILLLLFGISFIFMPDKILDWLVGIAGGVIIFLSLLKLAEALDKKNSSPFFVFEIIRIGALIFAGIMLLLLRGALARAICTVLGVYMIISSCLHLFVITHSLQAQRSRAFAADVILSVALIILGLWLTVYPLWPRILTGIAMILIAIELIGQTPGKKRRRIDSSAASQDNIYYTDDFEDKSDEIE